MNHVSVYVYLSHSLNSAGFAKDHGSHMDPVGIELFLGLQKYSLNFSSGITAIATMKRTQRRPEIHKR